jgi:uncharacterized protein (DUF1778 family)
VGLIFQLFVATIFNMMGRPPKPETEKKENVLRIRLTEADRATLDQAAEVAGGETSTWAREQLLAIANRLLRKGQSGR